MTRTVSRRTERMPQKNKFNRLPTIKLSAHPQGGQNKAGNVAMTWIVNSLKYSSASVDNKLEIVVNSTRKNSMS